MAALNLRFFENILRNYAKFRKRQRDGPLFSSVEAISGRGAESIGRYEL